MIIGLFLGLSPMINVLLTLDVFLSTNGLMLLGFGTAVGSVFAVVAFGMSVLGMPMLLDRDVDFLTAIIASIGAVMGRPLVSSLWGVCFALVTLIAMPILGHASWHLYRLETSPSEVLASDITT